MRTKLVFLAGALFAAVGVVASDVVPIEKPALVLKGRTLADVQTNEISGTAIGTHMRPRNMIGFNKVMLPAAWRKRSVPLLPRLRLARAGKAKEIRAWQNKWVEKRLPIAPPASGWTCEKLVDELVAAWEDFSKI